MEGNGFYNKAALCQLGLVDLTQDLLSKSIERYTQHTKNEAAYLRLADLGASQGRNSLGLLDRVLTYLDAGLPPHPAREYLVLHEDQPANDFASLLDTLNSPLSYIHARPNVFTGVIAKSFYERLVPSASIDIFVSYIAAHWLSAIPAPLPGSMVFWKQLDQWALVQASHPDVVETWRNAAHNDFVRFLRLRAAELADGGAMCMTIVSDDEQVRTRYYHLVMAHALQDMVAAGELSPATLDRMAVCICNRTTDEAQRAFADVPEVTLHDLQHVVMDFSFDSARAAADFFLSIFKPSFMSAMTDAERDDPAVTDALVARMTTRFGENVRDDVQPYYQDVPISYMYLSFTRVARAL
ncbi:Aste57867_15288 [Aphanomyces stellatus]|uniref:Aste57867_15288 protein n=1 Tax=Aphanomyces stellatus TaxID=120398 RepID=A0A485L3S5_9STRA|nr:hypothetical protein As57867_015232 [Aphanomyces stellatus]VFT92097.1 Aste57867_15288 [Aphanomyces stellatus]